MAEPVDELALARARRDARRIEQEAAELREASERIDRFLSALVTDDFVATWTVEAPHGDR